MELKQYVNTEGSAIVEECKKELIKCETLDEFDNTLIKFVDRFNKLVAFIILNVTDAKELRALLLEANYSFPEFDERRRHLEYRIKRDNAIVERLTKVGNETLENLKRTCNDTFENMRTLNEIMMKGITNK